MMTATFAVTGMTCGHCVTAVTEELAGLAGVAAVEIDLNPGGPSRVSVTSAMPLAVAAVRDAIDEAGYELVGATG